MDAQDEYDQMRQQHPLPWCWACGRGERERPRAWWAPWVIERSHIVNSPRIEDRRVCCLLCSGCHKTSHGERIAGWHLPKLELRHLIWLKQLRDPAYYDRQFMQRYSVKILPRATKPPAVFAYEYAYRRLRC